MDVPATTRNAIVCRYAPYSACNTRAWLAPEVDSAPTNELQFDSKFDAPISSGLIDITPAETFRALVRRAM